MLENNVNNNPYKMQFQAMSPQLAGQQQVPMQAVNPELLKPNVQDSYVANRAKASEDNNPFAVLGVGAAVWYALAQAMDKFNPKCAGDYETSALGKIGGFGDKISTDTYVGRKFETFCNWFKKKFTNLSGKSKIAYTLQNHATRPEWSFAKVPGAGVHGFLASDTEQVFEEFLKPIVNRQRKFSKPYNAYQKLEQYGVSQKYIDDFIKNLAGKTFEEKSLALQMEELKLLGVSNSQAQSIYSSKGMSGLADLAKELKIKKLGFDSLEHYNSLKGKFLDHPDEVMKALEKADKNKIKFSIWRGKSKAGRNLKGRIVDPSEYLNKYKAVLGKGNKTALGRFLPKLSAWFLEGTTNRFAGGKLAVAMQAFIFADMFISTWKAPKGEKGKTLAERFVNDFTYFLAMTAGIIGMHKIGGFKYAGLDKAGVENYRKLLKEFNQNVKDGKLNTKEAYKKASKALNEALGTKNIKNPITKLLQKIGKFINIGNERKLSYRSTSKYNLNFLRKLANGNIIGVPMRIVIPMFIISPFLAKWATKCCHAIFGKPTKSVLDEDKEPEATPSQTAQLPPQLQQPMQAGQNPQTQINTTSTTTSSYNNSQQPMQYSQSNLLNKYRNGSGAFSTTAQNTQSMPAQNNSKPAEPVRTYIPSPVGVQLTNKEDTAPVDDVLRRADLAEQQALQTLKMN